MCHTRQYIVDRGGDVNVLQVLQGLCVEKAKCGARAEGDPDAHAGHHHVGHHHALFLVSLQLLLDGDDSTDLYSRTWVLLMIHNRLLSLFIVIQSLYKA